MKRIEEIIDLLKCFKARTDKLGAQDDITITLIIPTFEYFRNTLNAVKPGESSMIKSMKAHMLIKLNSRYDEDQKEYLSQCSFLDPRFKKSVEFDMGSFVDRVKDIVISYTEIIHPTENQTLENIENESFAHTRREKPISTSKSNTSTSKSSNTGEKVHEIFTDDQSDDDTEITDSLDMITKIKAEIEI